MKLEFLEIFSKNPHASSFTAIRPIGAELFHADGRTGRHDEANSRFSQLCERALKSNVLLCYCPTYPYSYRLMFCADTLRAPDFTWCRRAHNFISIQYDKMCVL